MRKTLGHAVINALAATAYIALVSWIMTSSKNWLGPDPDKGIIVPIAFLLLFVVSASVMAITVFGRPLMWYLDGQKKEGIALVFSTLAALAIIASIVFVYISQNPA